MNPYQLFETQFLVRPASHHPQYFNFEFGMLKIWLYGNDKVDATKRATEMLKQLPYELVSPIAKCGFCGPVTKSSHPKIDEAIALGVALQWEVIETGNGNESSAKETWEEPSDDPE